MSQPQQQIRFSTQQYQSNQASAPTTTTTGTRTSYVIQQQTGYNTQPIVNSHINHIPGDLNCPCCNVRIVGEVNYNQSNYVEKQEIKKTVKEKIVPNVVSNKKFVPGQNTKYCSIPGCTVCEGMYRLKEETDTKIIIHREVSHACDFQCQFCNFNAADNRLLQLIEEHHIKMADIKRQKEEELFKQQQLDQLQQQQQFQQELQQNDGGYQQEQGEYLSQSINQSRLSM